MQKCKFPMEFLRVTQEYGRKEDGSVDYTSYSHTGSYALDLGGKDLGQDWAYAPCDMVVKRVYGKYNAVWFETLEKVMCADGVARQLVFMLLHINDSDLQGLGITVGKVFRYGEKFYREGTAGDATGNHIHLEVGEAPFTPTGWTRTNIRDRTGAYVWKINKQLKPHEVFILGDDVQILDGGGYPWKRVSDFEKQPAADTGTVYGVDVSHNRTTGIMTKIKANGKAEFTILRATVGSVEQDANLAQYIKDSRGMKIGFFSANYFNTVEDARAEADYLVDTIQAYGFTPDKVDLPLFCDWEYFSAEWNKAHGYNITPLQLKTMTVAFCQRIIERGYRAGVYLNDDFWRNWYGEDFFIENPDLYIWYARPGVDKPDRACYIWQYACNNGAEYGADEDLDKNILMGEYITNLPLTAPVCVECRELKEQLEKLTVKYEGKEAEVILLRSQNTELFNQLTEANRKLELAGNQIRSNDYYIEQLKTEKFNMEADKDQLKTEMAVLQTEKGVLKETIISMQERLKALNRENEQLIAQLKSKKGFFEKLIDILFGGA